jgi:hypothetical protein
MTVPPKLYHKSRLLKYEDSLFQTPNKYNNKTTEKHSIRYFCGVDDLLVLLLPLFFKD